MLVPVTSKRHLSEIVGLHVTDTSRRSTSGKQQSLADPWSSGHCALRMQMNGLQIKHINSRIQQNENAQCSSVCVRVCVTDVRQSPTKRRTMFGSIALATAAVVRKKSSIVQATTDTADDRPSSVLVDRPVTVGLGQYVLT